MKVSHYLQRSILLGWLLPGLVVAVALACAPPLPDPFELPKLVVLKVGLALALLLVAGGAGIVSATWRSAPALAAAGFLAVNALATLTSIQPRTSLFGNYNHNQGLLTLLVQVSCFFLAASLVRTEVSLLRLAKVLAAITGALSIYAIFQHVGVDPLGWTTLDDGRRIFGTLGHPNQVAELFVLSAPLGAWLIWSNKGRPRLLWGLGLLLMIVVVALTQARAAWVALGLQVASGLLLLGGLRWPALGRLRWLAAFGPAAGALALFVALMTIPSVARQGDAFTSQVLSRGGPLQARVPLWTSAWRMIEQRPVLGWGPDTFELVYPGFRSTELDAYIGIVGRDEAAHNIILQTAVNSGLVGLALYLVVQILVVTWALRGAFAPALPLDLSLRYGLIALLVSWVSYLVLFTSGQPRNATDWLAWLVLGACVGLSAGASRSAPLRAIPRLARYAAGGFALLLLIESGSALSAESVLSRGLVHRDLRELEAAHGLMQRAVALRPIEPIYRRELGAIQIGLARESGDARLLDSAVEQFSLASALSSELEPYTLSQLAQLEQELASGSRSDQPQRTIQRAIALDPENSLLYARAADLALRSGDRQRALTFWEAARARSRTVDSDQRLGDVALRLANPESARAAYRRAAEREWRPGFSASLFQAWAEASMQAGKPAEAVVAYEGALDRGISDEYAVRLRFAKALAASGQQERALSEATRLLEDAPTDDEAAELVDQLSRP